MTKKSKYSLIIHGGCGSVDKFTEDERKAYLQALEPIVGRGEEMLVEGRTALDVVEECVRMLENDQLFNAGKGSVLNEKGVVEMDASIMDGRDLKAGAVAGLKTIVNPVSAARLAMEKSGHVFLIGEGAEEFALKMGLEQADPANFIIEKRFKQWQDAKVSQQVSMDHGKIEQTGNLKKDGEKKLGTVGAVALDAHGNLAAATSTGGMTYKKFGRVGDSPVIGAGTYADNNSCAISCTGRGEDFIRVGMAKFISDYMLIGGFGGSEAATKAIDYFKDRVNGYGGFIMIDHEGKIHDRFTTAGLIRGWVTAGEKAVFKLF